ncbi:lysozyme inhibitor LprI family protein [Larkinella soli]|uniref:lysozyme inhibitor LprI family protein n=1 Tax=Larkinella soli TaxID=1770527 RepID=UPI000FFBA614|nr:lysozyme inhibitor LprI family protein [Larkinella soli]
MNAKPAGILLGVLWAATALGQQADRQGVRPTGRERVTTSGHPPELFINCDSAQTQSELNLCAQMRFQKADDELNSIYKQLMALLPKEDRTMLVQAQRQWIVYRDAHSKIYEKMYEGGSMMPMAVLNCKEETTQSRIGELKTLLTELKLRQ